MRCKFIEAVDAKDHPEGQEQSTKIHIYDLGVQIKEKYSEITQINERKLIFFFAGDFLNRSIKKYQDVFDWGLLMLEIDMDDLFARDKNEQLKYLKSKVQTDINNQLGDHLNCYPFCGKWITQQKYNW